MLSMSWIYWNESGSNFTSNIFWKMNWTLANIILKAHANIEMSWRFWMKIMTVSQDKCHAKLPQFRITSDFAFFISATWCFILLIFCHIYCFVKYRVIKYSLYLGSPVAGALQKQVYRMSRARIWMKRAPSVKICQNVSTPKL